MPPAGSLSRVQALYWLLPYSTVYDIALHVERGSAHALPSPSLIDCRALSLEVNPQTAWHILHSAQKRSRQPNETSSISILITQFVTLVSHFVLEKMFVSDYNFQKSKRGPENTDSSSVDKIIRPKFEDVTKTEDKYNGLKVRRTAHRLKSKIEVDPYEDVALLTRRRLNMDQEVFWVQLDIRSTVIMGALIKICGNSSFLNTKVVPMVIYKPYSILFHHRSELRDYAKDPGRSEEEVLHLDLLVDFMAKEFSRLEVEYNRLIPKGQISFPLVWTLFQPDDEVFIHIDNYVTCGIVYSVAIIKSPMGTKEECSVATRSWDYNGMHFGPVDDSTRISHFDGYRDITSLPAYPVRFHRDEGRETLQESLIKRGRKWKDMVDATHRSYKGHSPIRYRSTVAD